MASIDKIIANAKAAQINLAKARAETASKAADRAMVRVEEKSIAMEAQAAKAAAAAKAAQAAAAEEAEKRKRQGASLKAEPNTPAIPAVTTVAPIVSKTVKTAPIDTILFNDDSISVERMTNLIFEDIGGQELINIARNDIINGQKISYQPIKNISSIQQQYNHNNIVGIQNTSDKYFANFPIKFENKIPNTGGGPNGSNVYLDTATGDLVIETVNMENDEQIEVEITISATIYEAEFGEIVS